MDFTAIEAILPTQPDSALVLLDTLHTDPNDFTAKDRAHYYLLLTEAIDKCYLTHTTDSLIRLSADYYAAHHDNPRYAKALSTCKAASTKTGIETTKPSPAGSRRWTMERIRRIMLCCLELRRE